MRILITGASGLLGLNAALEAAARHTVFGQVNRHRIRSDAFTVLKADLLEPGAVERLLNASRPDWVIHCAAQASLEACERDPALAWQLNTEIPRILAAQCRKGGARLLHVSTDAVFDGLRGGYTESDTPNPLSAYARTKYEAEQAIAAVYPQAIIARVNLFGWSLSGRRSLAEFFFNNLAAGNPVMGFTDVFFCPLFVNHLAEIFLKMLEAGLNGLYHVVSPECLSKYQFGVAIARRFGFDPGLIAPKSIAESSLTAPRSPRLTLKVEKLTRDLDASLPTVSTGIEQFYTLYQQGYPQLLRKLGDRVTGNW